MTNPAPRAFAGSNLLLALMIRGGYMPEVENMSFSKWLAEVSARLTDTAPQAVQMTYSGIRQAGKSVAAKAWSKFKGLFGRKGA